MKNIAIWNLLFLIITSSVYGQASFEGNVSFGNLQEGNLVDFNIPRIENDSNEFSTGNIVFQIIGTYQPYGGFGQVPGAQLFLSNELNSLLPGSFFNAETFTISLDQTPTDFTYLWVGLYEVAFGNISLSDYQNIQVATNFDSSYTPPAILSQPSDFSGTAGQNFSLSISATGNDVSYQWFHNGIALLGENNSSLVVDTASVEDSGTYYIAVTNLAGTIQSSEVEVAISPAPPNITSQPSNFSGNEGENFSLSVSAEGQNITYQWYRNSSPIPDENSSSLNIDDASVSNSGTYYVEVINIAGTTQSSIVEVNIIEFPDSLFLLVDTTNKTFSLNGVATGSESPTYDAIWALDGLVGNITDSVIGNGLHSPTIRGGGYTLGIDSADTGVVMLRIFLGFSFDSIKMTGTGSSQSYANLSPSAINKFESSIGKELRLVDGSDFGNIQVVSIDEQHEISISIETPKQIAIEYQGTLQFSSDLETWQDLEPQPQSPYIIEREALNQNRFFRARN